MAQRLATEYVKAFLKLSKGQLDQFIKMFVEHHNELVIEEKPNLIDLIFQDDGAKVTLSFKKEGSYYVCRHSYRIQNHALANLMRKVMSTFKGDAIVNRIYSNYVMVYYYNHGSVVRITEVKDSSERLVYEYKNSALQLQNLFEQMEVEQEIDSIQEEINRLLEQRYHTDQKEDQLKIDQRLRNLSHQLFVLEA
jgi:hypothetical protein